MRKRERERFINKLNFTEKELMIRDRLYKRRKAARYKIVIYGERYNSLGEYVDPEGNTVYGLFYFSDFPSDGVYYDTIYFYEPDQFLDIIKLYEGAFYELYDLETGKEIGSGTLDPDSPVEEIRETNKECCHVCKFCFWRGMLYGEDKMGYDTETNEYGYTCYMNRY